MLLCAVWTLGCLASPVQARDIFLKIGDNTMDPDDIHLFNSDDIRIYGVAETIGFQDIWFGTGHGCTPDKERNTSYGMPMLLGKGELKSFGIFEPDQTVLHLYSTDHWSGACLGSAKITVYERSDKYFKYWVPSGYEIHAKDLFGKSGGSINTPSLAVEGTLVLDGSTEINVINSAMLSPQLESFYLGGQIVSDPNRHPEEPGAKGPDGFNLLLNIEGVGNLGGAIDLSGVSGESGTHGEDFGPPVCKTKSRPYSPKACAKGCTYFDDDQCKTGCAPCTPRWQRPVDCPANCFCCTDQTYQAGRHGGQGGDGGNGGKGGNLVLIHEGELYGGGAQIISNGGYGGSGGFGGDAAEGCDSILRCETVREAEPGIGGSPGRGGKGGNGGRVQLLLAAPNEHEPVSGYPSGNTFAISAKGADGGNAFYAGLCPDPSLCVGLPQAPGGKGGNGGFINVMTMCMTVMGLMDAAGGDGGDVSAYQACLPTDGGDGGGGGDAGEISIYAPELNYPYAYFKAIGGDGGKGATCVLCTSEDPLAAKGGSGGKGGAGGTVKLPPPIYEWSIFVDGGEGGEKGQCETNGEEGMPGTDGTSGDADFPDRALDPVITAPLQVFPGDNMKYTVSINARSVQQDNVRVVARVPEGTKFLSASDGGQDQVDTVVWRLSQLEPCQGKLFTLRVKVPPNLKPGTKIVNWVTVSSKQERKVVSRKRVTTVVASPDGKTQ
jgi:hypothetical protein